MDIFRLFLSFVLYKESHMFDVNKIEKLKNKKHPRNSPPPFFFSFFFVKKDFFFSFG